MLSGRSGDSGESFTPPAKVAAAAGAKGKSESIEDFPEALDGEDDDLPF